MRAKHSPITLMTASMLLLSGSALADTELKTRVEFTRVPETGIIDYKKSGKFDKYQVRNKRRIDWDSLISTELNPDDPLVFSARAGYRQRRTFDSKRNYRQDGSLKSVKSRAEWRKAGLVGLGFRYDPEPMLGGSGWSIRGYHERYPDVHYSTSDLGADAKRYQGSGNGYRSEINIRAEFPTPSYALYFVPQLEVRHEQYSGWRDSLEGDRNNAEQEIQYRGRLWFSWITPLPGWELTAGPTWKLERSAEHSSEKGWKWEDEEQWQAVLRLEYEVPNPGFEMEIQARQDLNGPTQNEKQLRLELSYEF